LLTTNAKKPVNGSKDADFRLDFLEKHKAPSCGWSSGPDQVGQKKLNLPLFWRNPRKTHPKLPNFLQIETRSLSASLEGLNTSLALLAGELWLK